MNLESRIDAVVFDLGNTLWFYTGTDDLDLVHRKQAEQLQPLVEEWGLTIPGSIEDLQAELWDAYDTAWRIEDERGGVREPNRTLIVQGAFAVRGVEITPAQAEEWWRAAWVAGRYLATQLFPDTIDVLRELHERGIRIGINSNRPCTGDMMRPDFEDFGIVDYIDAVVCSGDTGFVKPNPSTFERIIADLAVDPARTMMVGDSCARDCAPAKAMGMTTVLKLNGRYDTDPCADADYTIHDLAEILALPVFGRERHPVPAESPTPHDDANADRY